MKIPTKLLLALLVLTPVLLTSSQALIRRKRLFSSLSLCKTSVLTVQNRKICLQIGYCSNKNCPESLNCDVCVGAALAAATTEASTTEATTTIATMATSNTQNLSVSKISSVIKYLFRKIFAKSAKLKHSWNKHFFKF